MPDTVRQRLVSAVKARMQTILVAGGYATNMGQKVFVWKGHDWGAEEVGGVNIMDVQDDVEATSMGIQKEGHVLRFELIGAFATSTTSAESARKAIADIYKAIGTDRYWRVSGVRLALETELVKDDMGFDQEDKSRSGFKVTFEVKYRTPPFDPYTPMNGN